MMKRYHEFVLMGLGLIPFIFAAAAALADTNKIFFISDINRLISFYSLAIISFMSGAVWGISLIRSLPEKQLTAFSWQGIKKYFYLSNALTLSAWCGLFFAPNSKGFFIISLICFCILLLIDKRFYELNIIDKVYFKSRCLITVGVLACLSIIIFKSH
ncbi:MAG: hypothetical protein CL691_04195 [Cellvibrionales bacterium]|nr:hypothetical protein [Cellvibrionales bacterium]|tara:strand:- start:1608 stop:2081 length:474 start_codon:yes stop_codon:yes gene_type:complete